MGRAFKTVVPLDGYPRVSRGGVITHPLVGYEFVVPTKAPLHRRVPGESTCIGLVGKNTHGADFVHLHPRNNI